MFQMILDIQVMRTLVNIFSVLTMEAISSNLFELLFSFDKGYQIY